MIKQVSINRFEGNGIVERIEGNGWDIDAECIELNGINARIDEGLENRIISLDGPAVEDLFKSLRDLLKENSGLRETIEEQDACINRLEHSLKERDAVIDDMKINNIKNPNESANYCANDVLAIETLHLRQIIEEQDKSIKRLDKERHIDCCRRLDKAIEEKDSYIKTLETKLSDANKDRDIVIEEKIELIKILDQEMRNKDIEKDLKGKEAIIEEKNERIKTLNGEVRDKDIEIERLNNSLSNYYELYEKCRVLENKLKLADKWIPIRDFIHEATGEDFDFAVKTFLNFIPDYEVTVSVSRQEDDDND